MNLMGTYFAPEFITAAAQYLTVHAYANAVDELYEQMDEVPDYIPSAYMGADWMDTMPNAIPLWPAQCEVAYILGGNGISLPPFVANVLKHNGALPEEFNFEEPDYDLLYQVQPPNSYYKDILDYLGSRFAQEQLGVGVGLFDDGWSWPEGTPDHEFECIDMESLVPNWMEKLREASE